MTGRNSFTLTLLNDRRINKFVNELVVVQLFFGNVVQFILIFLSFLLSILIYVIIEKKTSLSGFTSIISTETYELFYCQDNWQNF